MSYLYLTQNQETDEFCLYRMKGGTDKAYSRLTIPSGKSVDFPVSWFTGENIPGKISAVSGGKFPQMIKAVEPVTPSGKKISEAGLIALSKKWNVELALIKAILDVESKGAGFLEDGRPKILFEAQWFGFYTNDRYNESHPHISAPNWDTAKQYYQGGAKEYDRLKEAIALDREAALKSASWGLGQVMGFNFETCSYKDVESFVADAQKSEFYQLDQMFRFIEGKGLLDELERHDWDGFSYGYNGSGYKQNRHHIKLKNAYLKHLGDSPNIVLPTAVQDGKILYTVPFYNQLDNTYNPHGTCNISTHAMWVKFLKPDALNSDEEYLNAFYGAGYKDSTNHNSHTELLRNRYGIESTWITTATPADLDAELQQRPVPIGILHSGSDSWPTGSHIVLKRGRSADKKINWWNDPYGSINNAYQGRDAAYGQCVPVTQRRENVRWYNPPSASKGGYMRKFIGFV